MSSRSAYTTITPEHANFPIPHTGSPIPSGLNPSSSTLQSEYHEVSSLSVQVDEQRSIPSQIYSWIASTKGVTQRNTGLLLSITSQAFVTLMSLTVKILNTIDPPVTALELITIRAIITYVCCVTYMFATNMPDPISGPKGVRLLLLFRGFFGFFGLFGGYYSLQYLSLSDVTVLTFLVPMCTAIIGALFLGEIFSRREAFAGLVSLVGVVLIARPSAIFGSASHSVPVTDSQLATPTSPVEKGTPAERLIAVGIALIGVLGASGAYTTIRAIGERAHPLHSMNSFSSMCIVASIVGMIATKTTVVVPTRIEWLALLFMVGIFGFVAQILMTIALQRETAGRSTLAVYTQIVFASILEKIVFGVVPSALSITGTLLIIVSAIYVVLTKEKQDAPTSKDIGLVNISQDAELEGLLSSELEDGDKLDRNVHFGDDDSSRSSRGRS